MIGMNLRILMTKRLMVSELISYLLFSSYKSYLIIAKLYLQNFSNSISKSCTRRGGQGLHDRVDGKGTGRR